MKVLVLGGAGYIGSHVCLELMEAGHSVCVFDNLSSGTRDNLFAGEKFIEGDIMNPSDLAAAMADGIEAVIHMAAFKAAGESMEAPEKYARNNISGTINVLNAMTAAGVRYFVFSSSAAVYGEPEYLPIDEKHPKNPENFYGYTKLEIEGLLAWYDKLKGLKYAALRYFNAAGYDIQNRVTGLEKNPANLLPVIMEVAAGMRSELKIFGDDYDTVDGTGVRDYVHVTDLAKAHVSALEHLARGRDSLVVNLGSEEGLSVKQILEAARRLSGQAVPAVTVARRPGDPAKLVAGSARAKELLGWQAEHSDVDTLVRTSWQVYKSRMKS
ncbi:MAG: UDP-glucose 4-epimerase GalE [Spirochaetes bacterium]|nr:UDP-glucose 4-epimerase GalE [Spirochaetota bacterium]MBU0954972.1 UDP-glucose 4-epimerase GalE [Spirochaetota bacterium]